jgi:DNA-binding transcriptional LysR family regulator
MSGPRPRITLDQLHTFVTLARYEHASRAAEALHLSQGAVSQQLQLLERTLKIPLFEHSRRRLRLTDAGRRIAEAAATVLNDARAVEEVADALLGLEGGGVSIVATGVVAYGPLPVWLASFLDRHPTVEITMRVANTADALAAVMDGSSDCAVVGGQVAGDELETIALGRSELAVVAARGHPLAGARATAAALAGHRYLARERGSATEILAPSVLGDAYRSGPVLELGRLEAVRAAVLAGLGYAVLPMGVIAEDVASGQVVVLPRKGRPVMQVYRGVRRRGLHTPAAAALWEHMRLAAAAGAYGLSSGHEG